MLKKLRNRMLLLCLFTTTIVMLAAFAIVYLTTYRNVQVERERVLDAIERHFNSPAALVPEVAERRTRFLNPELNLSGSFLMLTDDTGEMTYLYSYIDIPEEEYHEAFISVMAGGQTEGVTTLAGRSWRYRVSDSQRERVLVRNGVIITPPGSGLRAISFVDISESAAMLRGLLLTFVGVGLAALVVIFTLSLYLANRSIRPVEESIKRQKKFIQNASHELKTPLAIIAANADALLANGEDIINNQQKWLDYIRGEVGNMNKLVSDMLYLTKSENSADDTTPCNANISGIVQNTAAVMEAVLFEKDISLNLDIKPNIVVTGDAEKSEQLFRILFDNAAKYTPRGGEITVTLSDTKGKPVFRVKNTGAIQEKDLPHIFERFYRADADADNENGTGLGLAIAKAIAEGMGGKITARSDGEYTTFEIKF